MPRVFQFWEEKAWLQQTRDVQGHSTVEKNYLVTPTKMYVIGKVLLREDTALHHATQAPCSCTHGACVVAIAQGFP